MIASHDRKIGSVGTVTRVLMGLALLTLAYLNKPAGLVGGLQLHDLLLGLIALPTMSLAVGLLARRFSGGPLRLGGAAGTAVNLGVLLALFANHYTAGAAALFYGATLLVAAWRGETGCEFSTVSNAILGRDDQIGCPILTPLDALEGRHRQHTRLASSFGSPTTSTHPVEPRARREARRNRVGRGRRRGVRRSAPGAKWRLG
jgi:hypothetical protein